MATADDDEDFEYQLRVKREFERAIVKGASQNYSQDEYDFAVKDLWSWFNAEARAAGATFMSWEDFEAAASPQPVRQAAASGKVDKGKGKAKVAKQVRVRCLCLSGLWLTCSACADAGWGREGERQAESRR